MIGNTYEQTAPVGQEALPLSELALELEAAARERLVEGSARVKKYVVSKLVRALGIAFGAGVILGWLIKRR